MDTNDSRLTKKQSDRIEFLRRKFAPREGYEFKRNKVEVKTYEWSERPAVFLIIETGLIGDEGTMAEILARDTRMFMVGPRGGVRTNNGKRWVPGITWDKAY